MSRRAKGSGWARNTPQHTATHTNTLQHTATHTWCPAKPFCATCNAGSTHYNTLQHSTTHCNTVQHTATPGAQPDPFVPHGMPAQQRQVGAGCQRSNVIIRLSRPCVLQSQRQMLQCVAVCCSVLQCVAMCCSVLQCVAVCCSV